jgi:hypothetical protein
MLKIHPPEIEDSECGSSLVEFTMLMPLLLSMFSFGFSEIFETQLREQALTAFTFSLARGAELGITRDGVAEFARVLQADARFEHPPTLTFECAEGSQICSLTASYREVSHTSLLDVGLVHASLRSEFEMVDLGMIR